jgi:hypothetical protein
MVKSTQFFAAIFAVLVTSLVPAMSAQGQTVVHPRILDEVDWGIIAHIRPAFHVRDLKAGEARPADVVSVPTDNLPPILGAAIIVEAPPNGKPGRVVSFVTSTLDNSIYFVRGIRVNGQQPFELMAFSFGPGPQGAIGSIGIQDGDIGRVLPALPFGFQAIEIIRQVNGGGSFESLTAMTQSFQSPDQGGPDARVTGEQLLNGNQLALSITGLLGINATVVFGPGFFADWHPTPFKTGIALLPAGNYYSPGQTTVTICWEGRCGTGSIPHNLNPDNGAGGKG